MVTLPTTDEIRSALDDHRGDVVLIVYTDERGGWEMLPDADMTIPRPCVTAHATVSADMPRYVPHSLREALRAELWESEIEA